MPGHRIFLSGSSDVAPQRRLLASKLQEWLARHEATHRAKPYTWEADTQNGRLLMDRAPIQQQLLDASGPDVLLTVCIFSERCGVPLVDNLDPSLLARFEQHMASPGKAGIVHPWPNDPESQKTVLDAGGFALTGTVYELFSALAARHDRDNLVLACVANRPVNAETTADTVVFGQRQEEHRIAAVELADTERKRLLSQDHYAQVQSLFNLMKYLAGHSQPVRAYQTPEALVTDVMLRLDEKLRHRFGFESARNPFKNSLTHWAIDDDRELPGRDRVLGDILSDITGNRASGTPAMYLLHGPSGCGKSSVLQRGVMRRIRDSGESVLVLRPTDIDPESDVFTGFFALLCRAIADDWMPRSKAMTRRARIGELAGKVTAKLDDQRQNLTVGLDQFEEIIDELATNRNGRDDPAGWWAVMLFLAKLSSSPRVVFVATLENMRMDSFDRLGIEQLLQTTVIRHDLELSPKDMRAIAESGFARAGIELDRPLLDKLKEAVSKLAEPAASKVSVLPLVGLWLSELFSRFEHLTGSREGTGLGRDMNAAASVLPTLTLADLQASKFPVDFGQMIARVADEAWRMAGASNPKIARSDFDNELHHLLSPLVGVDAGGRVRLLAAPRNGGYATHRALLDSFGKARLLVPAGEQGKPSLVRIVHQALLDHWQPAKYWLEDNTNYLKIEERFRSEAQRSARSEGEPLLRDDFVTDDAIDHAAEILQIYRANWPGRTDGDLGAEDAALRHFATAVFHRSQDPLRKVPRTQTDRRHVTLAATYHFDGLLRQFRKDEPACINIRTTDGTSLIGHASWTDGPAIDLLLDAGLSPLEPPGEWPPIVAAIQNRVTTVVDRLLPYYTDIDARIGPNQTTLAHQAAYYDCSHTLQSLLNRQARTDVEDAGKDTALHMAAWGNSRACFEALLGKSDVLAVNSQGSTAVSMAAELGHADIVRAFLAYVSDMTIAQALALPDGNKRTPLMLAAIFNHPEVVRLLLTDGLCDPNDPVHTFPESQMSLLHMAVLKPQTEPGADERARARDTIEILLQDGRIDPNQKDANGKTAYDIASSYPEARECLRNDQRYLSNYEAMSDEQKIADLTSPRRELVFSLVKQAPAVLTDDLKGKPGLAHMAEAGRAETIAALIREGRMGPDLVLASLGTLSNLLANREHGALRAALVPIMRNANDNGRAMTQLLDAALIARDDSVKAHLTDSEIQTVLALDAMKRTILHHAALLGDVSSFQRLAQMRRIAVPRDAWGLVPSVLAPLAQRAEFEAIESSDFDPPRRTFSGRQSGPSVLHQLAEKGDLRLFERLAREADYPLPLDDKGQPPSALAPDDLRQKIVVIEKQYFFQKELTMTIPLNTLERTDARALAVEEVADIATRLMRDHPSLRPIGAAHGRRHSLPFYEDVTLLEFTDPAWRPKNARRCFLDDGTALHPLEGASPPIHAVNANSPPVLTVATALDYLSFFCFFVRGDEGPFLILDRPDTAFLPGEADRSTLAGLFRTPVLHGRDPSANWRATAQVIYGSAIFLASFVIRLDGMIEMVEDTAVEQNLPFRVSAPLTVDAVINA